MESIQSTGGSKKAIIGLLVAVILAVVGGGVWYMLARKANPKITVERERTITGEGFVVRKNGKDVAGFGPENVFSNTVKVYKQTDRYAYIAAIPEGLEGAYLLFDPGVYKIFRFDLRREDSYDWTDLSRNDTAAQAISPDDRFIAFAEYGKEKKVIIKDIQTGEEFNSPVAGHYGQFGSMHFSPDSAKLAYAAAAGFPGKESGAVFVTDLASKTTHLVALTKESDTYFIVNGWKDNEKVDYEVGPNLNAAEAED